MENWLDKFPDGGKIKDERLEAIERPDNTYVKPTFTEVNIKKPIKTAKEQKAKFNKLSKEEQERVLYNQYAQKHGDIKPVQNQSLGSKTWEVLTHPMTAAGYKARHENLPDNFSRGEINAHETATNLVNPFFYADEAKNLVKNVVAGHPVDAGMNALNILPLASEYKALGNLTNKVGKALGTEEGLLSRFNPNSIKTPEGFENKVFKSNIQLGEFNGTGHLSEPGYNYRTLSPKEIEAIQEAKGVFPRVGKQKGGNKNVKYWTEGNEKNWYGNTSNSETIRVNQNNFDVNKVVKAKDVEFYNDATNKFEPIKGYKEVTKPTSVPYTPVREQFIQPKSRFSQGELSPEMEPQMVQPNTSTYTPFQEDQYMQEFNAQRNKNIVVTPDERSVLKNSSVIDINDMKHGGVIKDDMGQWNHPGEITEIGSDQITMQGVHEPLIGISDTGHTQYMEPGKDYKFRGKKVTEFPLNKIEGWLSKYE